jgi:hypothetical protein
MKAPDERTSPRDDADGPFTYTATEDGDLTDMLSELRVLLPSAQLLSAFLITVPFSSGFAAIVAAEKGVFIATFVLAVASLVMLSAPAVQHRLIRPLIDRPHFKRLATRQIVLGSIALTGAVCGVRVPVGQHRGRRHCDANRALLVGCAEAVPIPGSTLTST